MSKYFKSKNSKKQQYFYFENISVQISNNGV